MNTTTHNTDIATRLDDVASVTGDGTELVTVSITPDTSLRSVRDRVRSEYAQAAHIQSDQTRDRVQRALNRIDRVLRAYDTTPANGLVVYAGVPDTGEDTVVSYVFDELPHPVQSSTYTCGDTFDTSVVAATLDTYDTYGLVIVERGRGIVGEMYGDSVRVIKHIDSMVMGKTRAGGQSAPRFERKREEQTHAFFQQIADVATTAFISDGDLRVTSVVVGGTTGTVSSFLNGEYLEYRLRDNVIGPFNVAYANETGLRRLVSKAEQHIVPSDVQDAIDAVTVFFEAVRDGDAVYGIDDVRVAATRGAVDTLLVADSVDDNTVATIRDTVTDYGGDVVIVPETIADGARFASVFTGVGAVLRFPLH